MDFFDSIGLDRFDTLIVDKLSIDYIDNFEILDIYMID